MKIKFNKEIMNFMSLFEKVTKVALKDCFEEGDKLYFIVEEVNISKAIGKNASNVKRIQTMFNRKIKIVGFNPEIVGFIKNNVYPVTVKDIQQTEKIITITAKDTLGRGLLIGRNAQNLRDLEKVVKRYFDIEEIKVE